MRQARIIAASRCRRQTSSGSSIHELRFVGWESVAVAKVISINASLLFDAPILARIRAPRALPHKAGFGVRRGVLSGRVRKVLASLHLQKCEGVNDLLVVDDL